MDFVFAAKVCVAIGLGLMLFWFIGSLVFVIWIGDEGNWFSGWMGGNVIIGLLVGIAAAFFMTLNWIAQ